MITVRAIGMGALLLASACTKVLLPMGAVAPGQGKSTEGFAADRAACHASTSATLQPVMNAELARAAAANDVARANADVQAKLDSGFASCMAARGHRVIAGEPAPSASPTAVIPAAAGDVEEVPADGPALADSVSLSALRTVAADLAAFRKACPGEEVITTAHAAPVAEGVEARVVAFTEPQGGGCFGNLGEEDRLLVKTSGRWRSTVKGASFAILPDAHSGYRDVVNRGRGGCRIIYRWNGAQYVEARRVDCA